MSYKKNRHSKRYKKQHRSLIATEVLRSSQDDAKAAQDQKQIIRRLQIAAKPIQVLASKETVKAKAADWRDKLFFRDNLISARQ